MEVVKGLSRFLEWGAKPPKPPWLHGAARHYAFRQAEPLDSPFVTICSIQYLFNCSSYFVQMHLSSGYLINQIFVQISTCSIDFLFKRFLVTWLFVQLFCSIVLVQFGLGESTCHPSVKAVTMFFSIRIAYILVNLVMAMVAKHPRRLSCMALECDM